MKLALARIAELLSATAPSHADAVAQGYSIDSRTIAAGELFIAIRGEYFDGHDFVAAALARGAVGAIVSAEKAPTLASAHANASLIAVPDTLLALQTLATAVRKIWGKPLAAVTGSAGKTSTKEAVARVLSARFNCFKSEGNLNNHFGLPLQLLRLERDHDTAVLELGMSHAGEIAALAKLAQPDLGVVTNVAPVHLEFFGSVADIARAKYELIESLPAGGIAVLNADDEYVSQFGRDFHGKVLTFGIERTSAVHARDIRMLGEKGSEFTVAYGEENAPVALPLLGRHNISNALAAVAVGIARGISIGEAATALSGLQPAEKRGQVISFGGARVINDCYNSNPRALNAMVDSLAALPGRRIVVAGEMLELGPQAAALHRQCGAYIASKGIDMLIAVRGLAHEIAEGALASGAQARFFHSPEEAGEWLGTNVGPGDNVLLKASRGVRLEQALEVWQRVLQKKEAAKLRA